ncbi:MAG TPA: methyltransferase domain-containing protein [Capsulimonadaceae bacterium]|nr:methyltransferase domain-containing protein [Capsulimonadaceae bacterium]
MELGPDNLATREFIYSLIDPTGVQRVIDLGCAKGHDLLQLGEKLPGAKRLVGLDISEKAVEAARLAARGGERFEFLAGDAELGLPFDDGAFDLVYSLNLLECVVDRQAMIRETHRVLGAGGQVICAHFDWDTQVFDGIDKALVRKIAHAFADWQQAWMQNADGWMGRRLWREFQRAGVFEGRMETYVLSNIEYSEPFYGHMMAHSFEGLVRQGSVTNEEYVAFRREIERLAERNEYFYSINMYIYTGRKV